ncbi:hypothetical protein IT570_13560 [Candidatus Sumerlaeota bacterium]|nr:hypothetical protein [Candidatus Sumerlaeota bacterium]
MTDSTPQSPVIRFFDGGWKAHGVFLALSVFFCLPMVMHPMDVPMGPPLGDTMTTQWNFWWVDQVIRGKVAPGDGLLHTSMLFHPLGADLSYHTMEFTYAVLLWPLRLMGDGFLQHNASLFLATYLMAWATWLAARQWGAGRFGAALCATALTLHGYRLAEGIHLNIFSTYLFPLTLYLLKRMLVDESRWRVAIGLGVAGNLAVMTSLFHTLECLIFTLLFVALTACLNRDLLRRMTPTLVVALLIVAPAAIWTGWHLATAPKPPQFSAAGQSVHAADVWQFLIHPRLRMALTGIENDWLTVFLNGEQRAWTWYLPGYLCVAAAIASAFALKKHGIRSGGTTLLWMGLFFWIMSLGPALKIGSPTELNPEPSAIPLPGRLLSLVPFLGTMRSVWHFGFSGTVCITIHAALWMEMGMRLIVRERRRLIQILALAIVAGESFMGPLNVFANRMDGAAKFVAAQASPGAVAIFPQYFHQYRGFFMYHQTIHERRIVGGYLSRDPIAFEDWKKDRQWPIDLEEVGYGRLPALGRDSAAKLRADVEAHDIRLVEIYDDSKEKWFSTRISDAVTRVVPGGVAYRDQDTMVITIREGSGN